MKSFAVAGCVFSACLLAWGPAGAQQKKSAEPKPLNDAVRYEPYPGTDIAQLVYKTTRQEFRVGRAPYKSERFQVAEFVLIAEHIRKYQRPDMLSEMKLAPRNTQEELMSNQVFQKRFKAQLEAYQKLQGEFSHLRYPKVCEPAYQQYQKAMEDEIFLADTLVKRIFAAHQIRDRELACRDLKAVLRESDADSFDRLCGAFEQEGNLPAFYEGMRAAFIDSRLTRARELVEQVMQKTGVEYAVPAEEKEKDITQ